VQSNYKFVCLLIVVVVVLLSVEFLVCDACAANQSYTIDYTTPVPTVPPTPTKTQIISPINTTPIYQNNTRIAQGQCIEIGGTYDITGVIGYSFTTNENYFAYYGRFIDGFDPYYDNSSVLYKLTLPFQRAKLNQFYMDPDIFNDRKGYWFQYTATYERAANKRAFYVSDKCSDMVKNTTTNQTEVGYVPPETLTLTGDNIVWIKNQYGLEVKHISDIILARGDPLFIDTPGEYQAWVFGGITSILAKEINTTGNNIIFDAIDTRDWIPGAYSIILEESGRNGLYEIEYETNNRSPELKEMLVPIMRNQEIVDITGFQPSVIKDKLLQMLKDNTDDNVTILKMEVQEPYVEIVGYQEVRVGGMNLLELTGYTNKIPDTPITLYVDINNATGTSLRYPAMTVMAKDTGSGNLRTFHGYFVIDYGDIAPGHHDATAKLPNGAFSTVSFYIREEPKPYYVEPTYYKFVSGNPFIPPVIVEKEVIKTVTKEVIKEVTIQIPVNYTLLAEEKNRQMYDDIRNAIPIVIGILFGLILTLYVVSVGVRAYVRRKGNIVSQTEQNEQEKEL
jgi:hypothetical protein